MACLRMILDRLWPPQKGQPVNVNMPPINDSQDVPAAIVSIWTALPTGGLVLGRLRSGGPKKVKTTVGPIDYTPLIS